MYCEPPEAAAEAFAYGMGAPNWPCAEASWYESGRGSWICGGCGRGDGLGPDGIAKDAVREREPSLDGWGGFCWFRSACNWAAKSGPRYCDSSTVRRFS